MNYKSIQITTDCGYEEFYICSQCSAIVEYPEAHTEWHQRQQESDNA